jgi:hypothetical protein
MPKNSRPDSTPADGRAEGRWAIPILPLRVNGTPLQFEGGRPKWHWTIHYMAYAGVTRLELASVRTPATAICVLAYTGCFILAIITGTLVQYLKADRAPRICGTLLGLTGFTFACIRSHAASHQQPAHNLAALAVPLSGAGLAFAINLIGEALATWFPAPERDGNQPLRIRRPRSRPAYSPASA